MPRQELSYSTPIKFETETLKKLREASEENQRSLSGEVRYRILQSFKPRKNEEEHAE